jgi:hypothetical protein
MSTALATQKSTSYQGALRPTMSTKINDMTMKSAVVVVVLLACAIIICLQFLYAAGQVYHFAIMAYKSDGAVLHMISFGRLGVLMYLVVATAMAIGLWVFIRLRGGVEKAQVAALLLVFSLANTLILISLLVMPYSDIVSRS